ncbi:uncharacterized protein ACN427_007244 [Glossina fuscipes fuscipes]
MQPATSRAVQPKQEATAAVLRRFTRIGKHQAGEASREPLPDETSPGTATTTSAATITATITPTITTETIAAATITSTITTATATSKATATLTTPPTTVTATTIAITTPPTTATATTTAITTPIIATTTPTITTPTSAVTISTRAATGATITPATGQDIPEYRSLAQRIADYQQKRHEIFSAEIFRRRALTRKHRKILILRQRRKAYRRFQQKETSAIVSLEHDDRMFARTKVDNTEASSACNYCNTKSTSSSIAETAAT